jgi:hypothetical protein
VNAPAAEPYRPPRGGSGASQQLPESRYRWPAGGNTAGSYVPADVARTARSDAAEIARQMAAVDAANARTAEALARLDLQSSQTAVLTHRLAEKTRQLELVEQSLEGRQQTQQQSLDELRQAQQRLERRAQGATPGVAGSASADVAQETVATAAGPRHVRPAPHQRPEQPTPVASLILEGRPASEVDAAVSRQVPAGLHTPLPAARYGITTEPAAQTELRYEAMQEPDVAATEERLRESSNRTLLNHIAKSTLNTLPAFDGAMDIVSDAGVKTVTQIVEQYESHVREVAGLTRTTVTLIGGVVVTMISHSFPPGSVAKIWFNQLTTLTLQMRLKASYFREAKKPLPATLGMCMMPGLTNEHWLWPRDFDPLDNYGHFLVAFVQRWLPRDMESRLRAMLADVEMSAPYTLLDYDKFEAEVERLVAWMHRLHPPTEANPEPFSEREQLDVWQRGCRSIPGLRRYLYDETVKRKRLNAVEIIGQHIATRAEEPLEVLATFRGCVRDYILRNASINYANALRLTRGVKAGRASPRAGGVAALVDEADAEDESEYDDASGELLFGGVAAAEEPSVDEMPQSIEGSLAAMASSARGTLAHLASLQREALTAYEQAAGDAALAAADERVGEINALLESARQGGYLAVTAAKVKRPSVLDGIDRSVLASRRAAGQCLKCGSESHFVRDCPELPRLDNRRADSARQPVRRGP